MSNLQIFKNENFEVRTLKNENNEVLFCLADICKVLEIKNPTDVKSAILREFELPRLNLGSFDTGYGVKEFSLIDEPQLYFVLNTSRSQKAKPFRMWVNKEVLPSIRKNGSYNAQPQAMALPMNYKEALEHLIIQVDKNEKLEKENKRLEKFNESLALPFKKDGLHTFREVCKILNLKEDYLKSFLMAKKLIYRLNGRLTASSYAIEMGYCVQKLTESETNVFPQCFYTPKFVKRFKDFFTKKEA